MKRTLILGPVLATLMLVLSQLAYSDVGIPKALAPSGRKVMPAAELEAFLVDLKAAREKSLLEHPIDVLGRVTTTVEFPDGVTRIVLNYSNKEIVDCVVDLYIAEWQRNCTDWIQGTESDLSSETDPDRRKMIQTLLSRDREALNSSLSRDGKRFQDSLFDEPLRHSGEAEADFHDFLAAVAESTFSEEIYPYVFSTFQVAEMRDFYLAYVRPSDTLDAFLNASVGTWGEVAQFPHNLYLHDAGSVPIESAMASLRRMAQYNESFRSSNREKILVFVRKMALYLADPTLPQTGYSVIGEPHYSNARDYATRINALHILDMLGDVSDVPFVRSIGNALPTPTVVAPFEADPPTVSDLAQKVEEHIRTRTTQ